MAMQHRRLAAGVEPASSRYETQPLQLEVVDPCAFSMGCGIPLFQSGDDLGSAPTPVAPKASHAKIHISCGAACHWLTGNGSSSGRRMPTRARLTKGIASQATSSSSRHSPGRAGSLQLAQILAQQCPLQLRLHADRCSHARLRRLSHPANVGSTPTEQGGL